MKTIKTNIIPSKQHFAKVRNQPHELNKEAICVFVATGFFLDQDSYFKDTICLKPATINTLDDDGYLINSETWFHWHYTPKKNTFKASLEEFSKLFETIIDEQVQHKNVILPLSGGLDSRTQAVALKKLGKETTAYSYEFVNGYPETKIASQIAQLCNFKFHEFKIPKQYLWQQIEQLAQINQCYSEFTHPRQMAIYDDLDDLGDIFSLGHWGDVLFDHQTTESLSEEEQLKLIFKKIVKPSGLELANQLWEEWKLEGDFKTYLNQRLSKLLSAINIDNSSAKIRAFKSLYWAPRWTSTNLSIFAKKHEVTLPYYDNRMCEFICSVSEEHLKDRQLQIAYIKTQNPKLAKVTWQSQKPYNLFNFQNNKTPYNLPYRILNKLKRETNNLLGKRYTQRNWELQFLGTYNDEKLRYYLFDEQLPNLISKKTIEAFYNQFKTKDDVKYSHAVSMLLTLALKMKLNGNDN